MICLVGQPDERDEESQLQHLQDIYDVTPQPSQKQRSAWAFTTIQSAIKYRILPRSSVRGKK
ncbi:hypothetical protein RhiirA5_364442 [Rhizophagus irregularis]|uniref:Uncharacterized protein n=1 Tax=Rhizophagus irregularis TaxID=588596 RepID=A0A2N0P5G8_9GLOM|nr:hypothetical protein RhiirA5_364442 [Rhizophagus irregularis]